jgi:predicted lipid-binding transport protein (Tim44 family)
MKKTIAVMLFVVVLGAGAGIVNVHAQNYQFGGYGPHMIAGLLGVTTGGLMMGLSDDDTIFTAGGIVGIVGAIDLGLGLLFMALDAPAFVKVREENQAPSDGLYLAKAEIEASTDGLSRVSNTRTASPKPKDNIFNHLDFATNGRNTYLGVRFSW